MNVWLALEVKPLVLCPQVYNLLVDHLLRLSCVLGVSAVESDLSDASSSHGVEVFTKVDCTCIEHYLVLHMHF